MEIVDVERDVQISRFSEHEMNIFKDALGDLETNLTYIPECEILDELEQRGKDLRSDLPNISDYLDEFVSHEGKKVLLIDLKDVTTNIPPTPQSYTTSNGPDLHPPDLYRGAILGIARLYGIVC